MGYRSQVECCIYGEPKDCATFLLKEADKIHACMEDWGGVGYNSISYGITPDR